MYEFAKSDHLELGQKYFPFVNMLLAVSFQTPFLSNLDSLTSLERIMSTMSFK